MKIGYRKGTVKCQKCGWADTWKGIITPEWKKCPFCGGKLVVKTTEVKTIER